MGFVDKIIETAKLAQRIDNIELYRKILDLQAEALDLVEQIRQKDEVIKDLQEKLAIQGQMKYEAPFYWRIDGDARDGPYCQQCWDNNRKVIRLQGDRHGAWDCPTCKSTYFEHRSYEWPEDSQPPPANPWGYMRT